jgi:hypothetical protein
VPDDASAAAAPERADAAAATAPDAPTAPDARRAPERPRTAGEPHLRLVEQDRSPADVAPVTRRVPEPKPPRRPLPPDRTRYSRENIVAKLVEWAERYGAPPTMRDWEPSRARRAGQNWRAERFEEGEWPSAKVVQTRFGTFNAALAAADLPTNPCPGPPKHRLTGPDQVVAAIVEWTRRYGQPPSQTDWDPYRARRLGQDWRVVRYRADDWPSLNTVIRHFGSLGAAVRAAGLEPRLPGSHGRDEGRRAPANLLGVVGAKAATVRGADGPLLARRVAAVAAARSARDADAMRRALIDLAAAAMGWADDLTFTELR